ncbi:probable PRM10 Pheromone-regulated protein [Phialocephala subalpina]|uniref:Probable PRM10 Pheromone-regulated protein n=1 Tax=Phialocephala subalpina TaxID=576137 RepID=A0A1L7WJU7_9HELO|nr:probable PRM10 Pheromone-regulated protein [Phialocephala subalpina]
MSGEYMPASENAQGDKGYQELSSEEPSAESSATPSRPTSAGGNPPQKKSGRVRFNSTSEANDATNQKSSFPLRDNARDDARDDVSPPLHITVPKQTKISPAHSRNNSSNVMRRTPERESENPFADPQGSPKFKPRPNLLRNNSTTLMNDTDDVEAFNEKTASALAAQSRAQRIASLVGSHSAPASRRTSLEDLDEEFEPPLPGGLPVRIDDIPLMEMDSMRTYDGAGGLDSDDEDGLEKQPGPAKALSKKGEAHKLVRAHSRRYPSDTMAAGPSSGLVSGQVTPTERQYEGYVPRPQQYRGGVLSSLLKLYNPPQGTQSRGESDASSPSQSGTHTASLGSSGRNTPKKGPRWYNHKNQSQDTLAGLIEASAMLGAPGGVRTPRKPTRPGMGKRTHSGKLIDAAMNRMSKPRLEDEIRITIHIAETLSRQKYLLKMCRALMSYGAPTHRLEEYMRMSARVLEIDGQFLYIPGCMIISFDDVNTHTTEVKIVKAAQGVDLGKLKDIHEVYKEVTHDMIGVEEATQRLDAIIKIKPKHNPWLLVFVYGLASATVGPFAFEARPIDLPISFILGCLLGFLQLIVAPRSDLYNNVFEISAAVLTSFLARAFGSIYNKHGDPIFCFSALAQSSIALILPGYVVLCGSLELQSKSMVAGSVRMVYAIIYSLFLGYGITIGTAIYGLMDSNATSATTCTNALPDYYKWMFVPAFTMCLCVINQAKWKQTPVMLVISFAGYIVNFFTAKKFPSSAQLSNTFGALAVGVLGNLYSRMRHGVAAAALIPAIFVQVPSGLAASGSLLAGISSADQITNTTTYANGTAKINGTSTYNVTTSGDLNTVVFNVGYSMIQVAIGITVGLFLSALIVYPFGKRRSGLFSF